MSRKDYQAFATMLLNQKHLVGITEPIRFHFALRIAEVLASENPRFDRARFMLAAGFKNAPTPEDDEQWMEQT